MMPKYQLAFLKLRQLQLWQTNSIVHPSVGLSVAHRLERYRLLQSPHDIEQLRALGKEEGACPYYAGRGAVGEAELVLLPCAANNLTTPCSPVPPLATPGIP